ncbi:hypothetical protein KP509_24G007300 [Ceratopteris richardii]|uniref:Retrovirus-related Pol polyprotein from transposon TNT 1-94-like beta-barrel domain-containing protein n=1 Tax=Ceratopteris richardii TaxID=49495 RepID=A0A8T2RUY2_CERRI|nr:hypothetical protein KP509_24G007300 [Ceratopteris richardii]
MECFLVGKGLRGLVNGKDECPELQENPIVYQQKEHKTWIEKLNKILHWISICICESLIPHIMNDSTPKEASDIIHRIYEIRKIIDDLACINNKVEDNDIVLVMLNDLEPQYKSLDTSTLVRGIVLGFYQLVALCMTEEVKLCFNASRSENSRDHDFYHKQNGQRGSRGHYASRGKFSAKSSYRYYENDNKFAMEHVLNSMSKLGNDAHWYIDSGCTNHMTCIGHWFESKEPLKTK